MSSKNKVIVILGNTRFDSSIQSTSLFIARNLARNNKVYFVEYPFTLKDYFKFRKSPEVLSRKTHLSYFADGLVETELPNLKFIVLPPVMPINFLPEGLFYRSMLRINEWFVGNRIRKVLKTEGVSDFVYINAFNFHFPGIAAIIKPTLTVYQCVDPMVIPYDRRHGILSELNLVKKSDLVICTSKALYEEKKQINPNTYLVPNAADIAHCGKALGEKLIIHPKLKQIPKPVIGYIGSIERRIDYQLLIDVAAVNPHKSFVLAGPKWNEYIPERLFKARNVYFTGPIPYREVPRMVKAFDVAIIPFKKDEVSNTIFPLKLFEFLAAGKPVVTTDFNPNLREYTDDTVDYCEDSASFSRALDKVIRENSVDKIQKRTAIAAQNSWASRAEQIDELIDSYLP